MLAAVPAVSLFLLYSLGKFERGLKEQVPVPGEYCCTGRDAQLSWGNVMEQQCFCHYALQLPGIFLCCSALFSVRVP